LCANLKQLIYQFDLSQLISSPTRVTTTTSTIIDLILVTYPNLITQSGILEVGLSDHMITYCTRKVNNKISVNKHNGVKLRSLKKYSKQTLEVELEQTNWQDVTDGCNVDKAWLCFKKEFLTIVDKIAPFKLVRLKHGTAPWITDNNNNSI